MAVEPVERQLSAAFAPVNWDAGTRIIGLAKPGQPVDTELALSHGQRAAASPKQSRKPSSPQALFGHAVHLSHSEGKGAVARAVAAAAAAGEVPPDVHDVSDRQSACKALYRYARRSSGSSGMPLEKRNMADNFDGHRGFSTVCRCPGCWYFVRSWRMRPVRGQRRRWSGTGTWRRSWPTSSACSSTSLGCTRSKTRAMARSASSGAAANVAAATAIA